MESVSCINPASTPEKPTKYEDVAGAPVSDNDDRFARIGRFYFLDTKAMTARHRQRLNELVPYFTEERLNAVLIPILRMESPVSLRALDWLVTNYAKKHGLAWPLKISTANDSLSSERMFSVFNEYKTWLRTWRRRLFDPFQRRIRIFFSFEGVWYSTTVGQLNFMYFSTTTRILDYANKNIAEIEKDQALAIHHSRKRKLEQGTKSRHELSQAPKSACSVFTQSCRLVFDSDEEEQFDECTDKDNEEKRARVE